MYSRVFRSLSVQCTWRFLVLETRSPCLSTVGGFDYGLTRPKRLPGYYELCWSAKPAEGVFVAYAGGLQILGPVEQLTECYLWVNCTIAHPGREDFLYSGEEMMLSDDGVVPAKILGLRSFLGPELHGQSSLDIGMPQGVPTATTVTEGRLRSPS